MFDFKSLKARDLNKIYIVSITVVILAAAFAFGVWYGYENRPAVEKVLKVSGQRPPAELQNTDFNLFWEVWSQLENKYVDKSKVNRQDMVYGSISGLVKSLKDPYTEFMPPPETKRFQEDIKGSFDGIGAEIGLRNNILTIVAPLKGSPAEQAGLKAGDKIIKIDNTITSDMNTDEAVRMIRGVKGTEVRLSIFRDGFNQAKEFKITRNTIRVPILTTEKRDNGIFVIKLTSFTENAALEFRKAIQEFFQSGSGKILLDLRNNPGGYLGVSVDIASWFMPAGEIVVREKEADGNEDLYRSHGYKLLENIPMVVLVNEGSASASEILAGALRDNKSVKLIGAKTFGKGSVQAVEPLPGGSSLKITIAKWLTPKGEEINGKGLEPDIKVEPPKETNGEGEQGKDLIMEKGLEVLKEL